jgi:hypothetical protein
MTAIILPNGKQSFTTSAGVPLVGGKLFTWDAGTSNPRLTWADAAQTAPNANPIILDGRGEATIFWSGAYRAQLQDSTGAIIWTVDGISSIAPAFLGSLLPAVDNTYDVGSPAFSWRSGYFETNVFVGTDGVPGLSTPGFGYWRRTDAEVAANVTPTNYFYEPGDIRRYGADPTGAVDSYPAVVQALLANNVVLFAPGPGFVYKIAQGPIVITGNKVITGRLGGSQAFQPARVNHTALTGSLFSATEAIFGGIYIGHLEIFGGNGSPCILSSRNQSLFEFLHMEDGSTGVYNGPGIKIDDSGGLTTSFGTKIRHCKWVGPASATNYRGFQFFVNGGDVTVSDCTAIRGSVGAEVLQGETIRFERFNASLQYSAFSSEAANAGQCAIRFSGVNYKRACQILGSYLEGCTQAVWVETCQALEVQDTLIDDLGNASAANVFIKDANSVNVSIRNCNILARGAGATALCIDNNGANTVVENNYLNANGGGGAQAFRTTTAVFYHNNTIIAGVTTDANSVIQDMMPTMGTWTPTIAGSGTAGAQTYSVQFGRYFKVGRRVFCDFSVSMATKDGATAGNIRVAGLPFTSANYAQSASGAAFAGYDLIDLTAGYTQLSGVVNANSTVLALLQSGDNVASSAVAAAAIAGTSGLRGSFSYDI